MVVITKAVTEGTSMISSEQSMVSVASIESMVSPHLGDRGTSLEQALESALEAEKIGKASSELATKLSMSRDNNENCQRIPNTKVRLFGGFYYRGTYIGMIDEKFKPHGLGIFNETNGFAISGGPFGSNNRGLHGIKYQGSWVHGNVSGYGKISQNVSHHIKHSLTNENINKKIYTNSVTIYHGRFLNGLKDGYGISRYLKNNEIFYQGEYLKGMKNGYGVQKLLNGKTNHNISYTNDNFSPNESLEEEDDDDDEDLLSDNGDSKSKKKMGEDQSNNLMLKGGISSSTETITTTTVGNKKITGGVWTHDFPVNKAAMMSLNTKGNKTISPQNSPKPNALSSPQTSPKPSTGSARSSPTPAKKLSPSRTRI